MDAYPKTLEFFRRDLVFYKLFEWVLNSLNSLEIVELFRMDEVCKRDSCEIVHRVYFEISPYTPGR